MAAPVARGGAPAGAAGAPGEASKDGCGGTGVHSDPVGRWGVPVGRGRLPASPGPTRLPGPAVRPGAPGWRAVPRGPVAASAPMTGPVWDSRAVAGPLAVSDRRSRAEDGAVGWCGALGTGGLWTERGRRRAVVSDGVSAGAPPPRATVEGGCPGGGGMSPRSRRPGCAGSPGKRSAALPSPEAARPDGASAEPRPRAAPRPGACDAPAARPAVPAWVSADAPGPAGVPDVARLSADGVPSGRSPARPGPGRAGASRPAVGGASGKRAVAGGGGGVVGGVVRWEGGRKSGKRGREAVVVRASSVAEPVRGGGKPVPWPARMSVSDPLGPPPVTAPGEPSGTGAAEPSAAPRGEPPRPGTAEPAAVPRASVVVPPPGAARARPSPAPGAAWVGRSSVGRAVVSESPSPPEGPTGRGGTGAWRASVLMHPPFPRARAVSPGTAVLVAPPGADSSPPDTHTRTSDPPSRLNAAAGITSRFRRSCASLYGLPRSRREPVQEPRGICPEHPPTLR